MACSNLSVHRAVLPVCARVSLGQAYKPKDAAERLELQSAAALARVREAELQKMQQAEFRAQQRAQDRSRAIETASAAASLHVGVTGPETSDARDGDDADGGACSSMLIGHAIEQLLRPEHANEFDDEPAEPAAVEAQTNSEPEPRPGGPA